MTVAATGHRELYEAYLKVPAHQRAEIIRGTLYVLPRPAPLHADAASVLGIELGGPFQRGRGGPGGWWIRLYQGEEPLRAEPFEAIALELGALWSPPRTRHHDLSQ